jgi:hypothetical protein
VKTFSLPTGTTGFTDNSGKWVCTGSAMGRRNVLPENCATATGKMRLVRLPFVDGCYDRWGAYWGSPANIWCATGDLENQEFTTYVFVRADSRTDAKIAVHDFLPKVTFYR